MSKTVKDIVDMKKAGKKITVLTSYDYALASLCDKADVDVTIPSEEEEPPHVEIFVEERIGLEAEP